MPSTVADVFRAADLEPEGAVRWGEPVPEAGPGVYVIALTDDPDSFAEARAEAPISPDAVDELLRARSELRLEGARPNRDELAGRLSELWLGDEAIVYIGRATSLGHRIGAYYRTRLGARRPHAGGWPLKTLGVLDELWVHYAPCADPRAAEHRMLGAFQEQASPASRAAVERFGPPLPFANLEWGTGERRTHGITGAREPRKATPPPAGPGTSL